MMPAAGSLRAAWWMFLSFGHTKVKVLDGGLQKGYARAARAHSGKVVSKQGASRGTRSGFRAQPGRSWLDLTSHASNLSMPVRAPLFEGSVAEPRPGLRSGHIPGSRNVPYGELFDAFDGRDETARGIAAKAFTRRWRRFGAADVTNLAAPRLGRGC